MMSHAATVKHQEVRYDSALSHCAREQAGLNTHAEFSIYRGRYHGSLYISIPYLFLNCLLPTSYKTIVNMCTKYVALIIYTCGKRVLSDVKFDACGNTTAAGHRVVVSEMGSTRGRNRCGRYDCAVCNPPT